ncbi:MAG: hypothetical protein MK106_00905 [Mariniblastus sp.]|nr:hypothetical protein [Mariniblastus sp.]
MNTLFTRIAALFLILVGIVLFILPIPLGAITITIGAAILYGQNPKLINFIRQRRVNHFWIDQMMKSVQRICPQFIGQVLIDSTPDPFESR